MYAVWYHSAGCLPDGDGPEFVGILSECEVFINEHKSDYERPEVTHDLYSLYIEEYDGTEERV